MKSHINISIYFFKGTYQVGDLVYARFVDMEWYRAVVVSIEPCKSSATGANDNANMTTDLDETFESSVFLSGTPCYEVFFIDYGNKHTILSPIEMCSLDILLEYISQVDPSALTSVQQMVNTLGQAHRCSFDLSIARTPHNLELIQTAFSTNTFFDIDRVFNVDRSVLISVGGNSIDMFNYRVSLRQNDRLVEEMFEKVEENVTRLAEPVVVVQKQQLVENSPAAAKKSVCYNSGVLKTGKLYKCKLAHMELETNEIFVNLMDEIPKLVRNFRYSKEWSVGKSL